MRKPLSIIVALGLTLLAADGAAAAAGDQIWISTHGSGTGSDAVSTLQMSQDASRVFAAGQVTRSNGTFDFHTMALDASTGESLWSVTTGSPKDDQVSAAALSSDGLTLFVTGGTRQDGRTLGDYLTVAYDTASGEQLWSRRYDSHKGADFPHLITVTTSAVVVTGYAGIDDAVSVAYSPSDGSVLWKLRSAIGQGHIVGSASDGTRLYLAGFTQPVGGFADMVAIAVDLVTGAEE